MTEVFDIQAVRGALARGYCALPNRRKELDSNLLEAQAEEIMALVERLSEEEPSHVAVLGTTEPSDAELRQRAYELAIKSGMGHGQDDLHKFAERIYARLKNDFDKPTEVISVKLAVDTSEIDDIIARQFGRTEWRREAWNDLKALMIRVLNQQIKDPKSDSFVLKLDQPALKNVRAFVSSFLFDPDMP